MRLLIMVVGVSVLLHAFFAWHQPFTNDEGAYLYDARAILRGELPAGDVLTKAPVPIALFAVAEFLTRHSLFASRIVNSIASLLTAIPLFFLLRELGGTRTARIGVALWLLGSGTIIFNTMGHTQTIASLFAASSLCFFILGIASEKISTKYLFFAGVCFALAYASRKTAALVFVPIALSWIILRSSSVRWLNALSIFIMGVLSVCSVWFAMVYALYGFPGVWHALGVGYGAILLKSQTIEPWAGSSARMFAEAVRTGALYGLLLLAACAATMKDRTLIGTSWVVSVAAVYVLWPTHLVEYLADFILPIVIAGAVALGSLRLSKWQTYAIVTIFACVNVVSLYALYTTPWTGMFSRDAIEESAAWFAEHVPYEDEVFTAAVIVPYVSGHRVPFHLSHPQWYQYSFISESDKNLFLPSLGKVQDVIASGVSWILHDQLTAYSYPEMNLDAFQEVVRIPNTTGFRTNPLRVYLRE